MQLQFQHGEETLTLAAEPDGDGYRVRMPDGTERSITAIRLPDDSMQITLVEGETGSQEVGEQRAFRVPFSRSANHTAFSYEGRTYAFAPVSGRAGKRKPAVSSGALMAPMAGVVVDVLVTVGQDVEAYQPLAVIEAMKVMTTLQAPFAGMVASVSVQKQQQIAHGSPVVEITPHMPAE